MDSSGFLSPKANAFSIAHLIDRAQLADLAFLRQNPNCHWNSQVLLREMEGIGITFYARAIDATGCHCLEAHITLRQSLHSATWHLRSPAVSMRVDIVCVL